MNHNHNHDHHDRAALERDLQARRQHISQLVGALEDRLSPGQVFDRVWTASKDSTGEFARNLGHAVKANPMPTLLTAAGMAWLYAAKDRDSAEAAAYSDDQHARPLGEARDKAHHAAQSLRQRAHRTRMGAQELFDDNPLAVGAMAVAAGALLGALLPETRREDEMMGNARDRLRDRAEAASDSALHQARRADARADGAASPPATH